MSTSDIPNPEIPPAPPKNRKLILAWMIAAQVLSVLFILLSVGFGIFISLIGGGMLAGGDWNYLEVIFFSSPLFLIPIIVSWVTYKREKVWIALILTTVTFLVLVCPGLLLIAVIALS